MRHHLFNGGISGLLLLAILILIVCVAINAGQRNEPKDKA